MAKSLNIRRLTALLVAALMAGSLLTACAGSGEQSASAPAAEDTGSQPASEAAEPEAQAEQSAGGDAFTLLSWYTDEQMREYLQGFESESGIKIDLQFVPAVQQYIDKFMVLVSSNQMTDMFFMAAENKQEIIERSLAEDLSGLPIFQRIPANVSATYGDDGKIFAYSPDAWVGGVFYNKAIFEQAGIAGKPATWAELMDACQKIKDLGLEPIVGGSEQVHEMPMNLYVSQVISQDPDNDRKINQDETTFAATYTDEFTTWFNDMYATGLQSQISLGLNNDQAIDMFVTGQCAMFSGGPWNIATFQEKNPEMEFDVFPIPDKDGNAVLSGALNVGLSISSATDKKAEGTSFIEYMSRDENILKWQKTTCNILVVEGLDYEVGSVFDQYKADAVAGNFYLPQIVWDNSAGIYKELLTGIQDVMTGADTIDNVPVRLDTKMQELNG